MAGAFSVCWLNPNVPKATNSDARVPRSLPVLYLPHSSLSLSFSITNDRAAPEGQRQSCRLRRTSSAVIPRPVDRPVSHGLKRSVEVLIRVSDRVPRPLITEPDLIRCPPVRRFTSLSPPSPPRDARAMRDRSGDGGFKSPARFKPFDERPPDNCREFAARSNESMLKFSDSAKSVEQSAWFFLRILNKDFPLLYEV